ncbi:hypothetical protein IWZ00DRAFT_87769 [Phyllosticta capitalensis]
MITNIVQITFHFPSLLSAFLRIWSAVAGDHAEAHSGMCRRFRIPAGLYAHLSTLLDHVPSRLDMFRREGCNFCYLPPRSRAARVEHHLNIQRLHHHLLCIVHHHFKSTLNKCKSRTLNSLLKVDEGSTKSPAKKTQLSTYCQANSDF